MRIALVVTLIAAVGAATAVAGTRAHVAVMATAPVTIHGTSFQARERVTLTVTASSIRTKVVRATARGTFTATFTHFVIAHCQGYVIRAKGNDGSLVTLKVTPECPPPSTDPGLPTDPGAPKKPH
jgi:hypothetical protein